MCGIAGVYYCSAEGSNPDPTNVQRMLGALRHRGPDAEGIFSGQEAVLGHRRLAIIDLSEAGRQPMGNEDGAVQVTFNGEIYNYRGLQSDLRQAGHRFSSDTDTEVLAHGYEEWGIDGLLARLRGMFAFALLDERDRNAGSRLFLVRDRLGIKPLYYTLIAGKTLYFASEAQAIRSHTPVSQDLDPDALLGYLALGSTPSPRTLFRDIHCLPPGHYLDVSRRSISLKRYWDLRAHQTPEEAQGETFEGELRQTVLDHLISDVPLGVFLSGGVDSAGLVALASGAGRLTTLTVTFDEQEFDESAAARQVANHFATDHREIKVTSREFLSQVPGILEAMDQPTHDGINTYFVCGAARKAGLTVVLSGLGGDEVFWGYNHYRQLGYPNGRLRRLLEAPTIVRRLLAYTGSSYGRLRGRENLGRLDYLGNGLSAGRMYLAARGFFAPAQIQRLLGIDSGELRRRTEGLLHSIEESGSSFPANLPESFNYLETARYLHDQLLRDTDVFSMAHSIEARVPYLDHRIVEMAAAAPASRKLNGSINKPMLVKAIHSPVVDRLSRAPKRGFIFPFQEWMRQHSSELEGMTRQLDCLDGNCVRELWNQQRAGRLHWSRAWSTVALAAVSGRRVAQGSAA